eukprot:1064337-Pyramimonas_sp.AAC.1
MGRDHGEMVLGASALLGQVEAPAVRDYEHWGSIVPPLTPTRCACFVRERATALCDGARAMFADRLLMSGRLCNAAARASITQGRGAC